MIAVVIPCYKVKKHIQSVINSIGTEVNQIYVVDDCCPENTGKFVLETITDARVKVLFNKENKGVGGAVIHGYQEAIKDKMSIAIKLDGDGQMDASLIPTFIGPILRGEADYVKGNRFYQPSYLTQMPMMRLIGNSVFSFVNKVSSGYWNIMDPTNGFTAISIEALKLLPLNKIDNRYFFESEMLFRLNIIKAVVYDLPMPAFYADEKSNMNLYKITYEFPVKYLTCFIKRVFYNYFLRDFNVGSIEMIMGSLFLLVGVIFGGFHWYKSVHYNEFASNGTVMLSGLLIILGFQSLLAALNYDVNNIPQRPISNIKSKNN